MKRSAGLISIIYGLTTAIQILGQIIIARLFGAGSSLDTFVAAVTIPTVLTTIIAGTFNDAFLPLLKKKQHQGEEIANTYFIRLLILLGVFALIVSFLINIGSIPLLRLLFGARGEQFIINTDNLMRWMIYTLPFTVVGAFCTTYLYSKSKFIRSPIAYFTGSVLNLFLIVVLAPYIGIMSMVIAFISSIMLQLALNFPYRISFRNIINGNAWNELKILLLAWVPLIMSSLAVRFDSVLERSIASHLSTGYIVYINLAASLFSGLVGVMTIGLQIVFFPRLVDYIQNNQLSHAVQQVRKAKFYGIVLSIIVILIIMYIAPIFMRILLIGGRFKADNVETLISLFPYFIIPAIGWGVSQLFFQPIIALGKQHYLTILNVCAVILSWGSATLTYPYLGGLMAISIGLIILTFTGIIGSEILWQQHLNKHLS